MTNILGRHACPAVTDSRECQAPLAVTDTRVIEEQSDAAIHPPKTLNATTSL
jgi:hypothetical protein